MAREMSIARRFPGVWCCATMGRLVKHLRQGSLMLCVVRTLRHAPTSGLAECGALDARLPPWGTNVRGRPASPGSWNSAKLCGSIITFPLTQHRPITICSTGVSRPLPVQHRRPRLKRRFPSTFRSCSSSGFCDHATECAYSSAFGRPTACQCRQTDDNPGCFADRFALARNWLPFRPLEILSPFQRPAPCTANALSPCTTASDWPMLRCGRQLSFSRVCCRARGSCPCSRLLTLTIYDASLFTASSNLWRFMAVAGTSRRVCAG